MTLNVMFFILLNLIIQEATERVSDTANRDSLQNKQRPISGYVRHFRHWWCACQCFHSNNGWKGLCLWFYITWSPACVVTWRIIWHRWAH